MNKLKWCIKRTPENAAEVNEWVYKTTGSFDLIREYYVHSEPFEASRAFISHLIHPGFHEINLDEFRLLTNPDEYSVFSGGYNESVNNYYTVDLNEGTIIGLPHPFAPVVSLPVFEELMRRFRNPEESIIDPAYIIASKFEIVDKKNPFKAFDFVNELPADISDIIERIGARKTDQILITFNPVADSWIYKMFHENQPGHCPDLEGKVFDNLLNSHMSDADKLRFIDNALSARPTCEPIPPDPFADPVLKSALKEAIESGKGIGYGYDGENEFNVDTFDSDYALQQVIEVLKKHFGKR